MHSVLRCKHVSLQTAFDKAFKQRAPKTTVLSHFTDYRWRQLLVVANQDQLSTSASDWNQSARFTCLSCFIHQNNRKTPFAQKAVTDTDGGCTNHFCAVKNCRNHVALELSDFFEITIHISVRHAFLFSFKAGESTTQVIVLFTNKTDFFLERMVFDLSVKCSVAKMFSNLHWTANPNRIDVQFKQPFQ